MHIKITITTLRDMGQGKTTQEAHPPLKHIPDFTVLTKC